MKPPVMRLALISEHASPIVPLGSTDAGGQNVYVDEIGRHLGARGIFVDVFTRRDRANVPEIVQLAPNVRVVHVPVGAPAFVPKDALWPLMAAFYEFVLRFMMREGVRYDLVHGNFWMSGWVAARMRQALGIPAVQIFHALGATKRRHQGDADTSPPERLRVEREIVRRVDRIIAQCPAERDELIGDYGASARAIALIPSGVNIARFRPIPQAEARRLIGVAPDERVVVYVGRMLPRKDVRNVVRATALLAAEGLALRLLLVGGETAAPDRAATPEIGALQDLAAELGIAGRVTFVGKRQPDELHRYYCAGDVAVTTPWYEPFGLTPLEAMACGRPVVGAAVGGLTSTIVHGETGFLVPPRAPATLAKRLRFLLERPELCATMGAAARRRVEQEFTWPVVAERTAALYADVLAAAGRRRERPALPVTRRT
jgi:D-inositol-3-phosphate glycosyltransferase